ncbi:MAG: helix-turn-helix transcriptional regulator [Anaerolineales bacterium]|nr:helix-turn-helix transcriptional regulator [Anaerolineales bacterium]
MSEPNPRAKLLGKLIQEARAYADRTAAECAAVLGMTAEQFAQAEQGVHAVSLPDLEVLALFLEIPMGYFWGSEQLPERPHIDYADLLALRQRVVGVLLRQKRLREKRSLEEVAAELDVPLARVEAYEAGDVPIPYLHLEKVSRFFDVSVDHFLDDGRGPLGRHEAQMRLLKLFKGMSPEMQQFLANPQNMVYLETAERLSVMEVQKLRQIAESILEITW